MPIRQVCYPSWNLIAPKKRNLCCCKFHCQSNKANFMISFEAALSSSSSSCEASNLTFASALKIFSSKKTVSRNVRVAGRFYDLRLACSCPQRASFNDVTILPATTNSYREHKIRYYLMNLFVGQSRPLLVFFRLFHASINFYYQNWRKHSWCAWDSNLGLYDCGRRHWAMATAIPWDSVL